MAQFKTLADITDPVEAAAYADVLTSFGRIAQLNDLGAEAYESSVKALVDFAGTNPGVATELVTTRPLWVKAAALRGPGPLTAILDSVVGVPLLRDASPDVIGKLVRRSSTELDEIFGEVSILGSLNPEFVVQSKVDRLLSQADVLGGLRQLKVGSGPRVIVEGENVFILSVTGDRKLLQTPTVVQDEGLSFVLADGVRVPLSPDGYFLRFPDVVTIEDVERRVKFATVNIGQSNILRTSGDFNRANEEMRRRIQSGVYDRDGIDDELRDWFLEGSDFRGPPMPSDGREFTWHHSEITGQLELVDRAVHQGALPHIGGNSLYGNGVAS